MCIIGDEYSGTRENIITQYDLMNGGDMRLDTDIAIISYGDIGAELLLCVIEMMISMQLAIIANHTIIADGDILFSAIRGVRTQYAVFPHMLKLTGFITRKKIYFHGLPFVYNHLWEKIGAYFAYPKYQLLHSLFVC